MNGDRYWVCAAGDTFDLIAMCIWDDEKYARELMQANLLHCGTLVFRGGERLRIPDVDRAKESTAYYTETAPWKE